jgi:branched-chain amino acid transport system substrate-binding protein
MKIRILTPDARTRRRRTVLAGAAAVAVAAFAAGCGSSATSSASSPSTGGNSGASSASSDSPIKVALISDLTGAYYSTLEPTVAGELTAIHEINATGGINGRKIDIVGDYDAASTAQGGENAAQEAISAKPDFIIASDGTLSVTPALAALKTAGIPVVASNAPDNSIVPPLPWLYAVGFTAQQSAAALLNEVSQVVSTKPVRIAITGLDDASVDPGIVQIQKSAAAYGATVVSVQRTSLNTTSFTSQAAQIVAAKPNVVMSLDTTPNTVLTSSSLKTAGFTGPILGTYGAADDATIEKINNPLYLAYRDAVAPSSSDPLWNITQQAGQPTADTASPYFGIGYSMVYVVKTAMSGCGSSCSISSIQQVLQSTIINVPNDALVGPIKFTSASHAGLSEIRYFKLDSSGKGTTPAGSAVKLVLKG